METLKEVTLVTKEKIWSGFDNDILLRLLIAAEDEKKRARTYRGEGRLHCPPYILMQLLRNEILATSAIHLSTDLH